jgi:hypothetical protein
MKLKSVFFITASLFFGINFFAGFAAAQEADGVPKLVMEQTTVEFSTVIAGSEVTHTFTVQNKGSAVLAIPGIYTH